MMQTFAAVNASSHSAPFKVTKISPPADNLLSRCRLRIFLSGFSDARRFYLARELDQLSDLTNFLFE
jgi:hypothetical protein